MAMADVEKEVQERVKYEVWMWIADEISMECDVWAEDIYQYSPDTTVDDTLTIFDDLNDSLIAENVEANVEIGEMVEEINSESLSNNLAIDNGEEAMTYTFAATTLANINSTIKTELYDSGASHHMLPYCHKFINFIPIKKKLLTAADGGHFKAVGKGNMHILMPNGRTMTMIPLKDVLYAPKMGMTLVSIGKIDMAGYAALFHKNQL
jgi:hypothetical protein